MKKFDKIVSEKTTGHMTRVIRSIRQELTSASGKIADLKREMKDKAKDLKQAEKLVDQARKILFDLQ